MTLNAWNGLPDPKMPAQASTEQERAEFQEWGSGHNFDFTNAGCGLYAKIETQAAWMAWEEQAARRAPVVLNGWKLVPDASNMTDEQAEAICNLVSCCGGGAHEVYEAALAAAPQPPAAATSGVSPEVIAASPDAAHGQSHGQQT